MTAKNAISRGPLGDCPRTAASSRRACAELTTPRRSTSWAAFGGFHLTALTGLAASSLRSTAYSSALATIWRLVWPVQAAAGLPSSRVSASRTLRITSGAASAETGLVLRDSHLRIAAAFSGA
jgi:hypothetical protein